MKNEGDRTKQKLRAWLDKTTLWKLADLKRGQAYQQIGNTTKFIEVPKYRAKQKPTATPVNNHKSLLARLIKHSAYTH